MTKQNPVAAGTRPVIPHHPSGQHFHFTCSADGTTFQMLVIFVYEQDERTLRIRSIGFRRFIL